MIELKNLKRLSLTGLLATALFLPVLHGCSSTQPVVRTETRTVPKLEFVPVPEEATAPCLVSLPPVDASTGTLPYEALPAYTAHILGVLEECNLKLDKIKELQPPPLEASGLNEYKNSINTPVVPEPRNFEGQKMVVKVFPFNSLHEMQQAFNERTGYMYPNTARRLGAVTLSTVIGDLRYCEVFVVKPQVYGDARWSSWGHELGHCVWGQWHAPEEWN